MQIIIWLVSSFVFSFINLSLADCIGIAFPRWVASFVIPSVIVSIYEIYLKRSMPHLFQKT